jgi:hypothetical protein
MLEKEFVPYEPSLALKELGFDEPCFGYYSMHDSYLFQNKVESVPEGFILTPTFSQAFRWFREKYDLNKTIDSWTEQPMGDEIWDNAYQYYVNGEAYHPYFKTYEEAELECLKKLIEIVENNSKNL